MGNRQGKALTYHGNDRSFAKMAARNCQQQYPDIDDAPPLPHSPAHGEFRKDDIGTDTTNNEYFGRPGGMELSDFNLIRSVGRGSFGRVMIVSRRSDNRIFALKYISKAQCIRQKAVRNVINERRILQRLSHPLVCNLQAAFQDDEHMYIMLDPMMGGDLAFHLERCEYFPENVVKSYICEIALALRYLHKQRIVHRDVKPANILLDERGHCHLTDFNVAGRIRRDKPMKSLAGTYSYMAPEVFQQKGYYESVDWWSLGVLMFELLYGKPPFRGKSKRSIGEAVLKHQITYPKKIDQKVSSLCTDAILSFLEPKARDRLGCKYRPFKEHPYFHDVEWDKIENKQLSSLFQPDPALVKTDALYHLEEVLLHEAPLQHKKRKKSTKPKTYPADSPWQLMLDEFKDFDREVWEKHQRDEKEKKQQMQQHRLRPDILSNKSANKDGCSLNSEDKVPKERKQYHPDAEDDGQRYQRAVAERMQRFMSDDWLQDNTDEMVGPNGTDTRKRPALPSISVAQSDISSYDEVVKTPSLPTMLSPPSSHWTRPSNRQPILAAVKDDRLDSRMKLRRSHNDLRYANNLRGFSSGSPAGIGRSNRCNQLSGVATPDGSTRVSGGMDYGDYDDDIYGDVGNFGEEEEEEEEEEEVRVEVEGKEEKKDKE